MAGAACSLPSSLGVGGVALAVKGPLEALEQVAAAPLLGGGRPWRFHDQSEFFLPLPQNLWVKSSPARPCARRA